MRFALISTVFNEAATLKPWIDRLSSQTSHPDEFIIVDGGSTDATVSLLEQCFKAANFPKPRIIVQRCNIAEGRNIAIRNATSDIIVSIDAGSQPDVHWFEEITRPFREHPEIKAVGGYCPAVVTNNLQRRIDRDFPNFDVHIPVGGDCSPSSRNAAYRRDAWEAVGGYPEWLTLTAEDMLFNQLLQFIGIRFYFQPTAIVAWENRPTLRSFLRMMKNYGYGCGEARQAHQKYLRWLLSVLFPPLLLLSKKPIQDVPFRFLCNLYSALGWISGICFGHRPPSGWKRVNGMWISPQAIATAQKKSYAPPLIAPDEKFA